MSAPGTGKASGRFTTPKDINNIKKEIAQIRGLVRLKTTPQSIITPIIPPASPSSAIVYNYLKTQGDTMNGPLALGNVPATTTISGGKGHLDVSKTAKYSSNVILTTAPSGGSLSYIDHASFDGQILILHLPSGQNLTLPNNGNIVPFGSVTFSTSGTDTVMLVFDSTVLGPDGSSAGSWIQITGGNAGSNTNSANKTLSNLGGTSINADLIPNADNSLNIGSITKRWATAWSLIFKASNSRIFDLSQASQVWLKAESSASFNLIFGVQGVDNPVLTALQKSLVITANTINLGLYDGTGSGYCDVVIDTLHGTRFGTSKFAKLSFFGLPPQVQASDNISTGIAGNSYTANERNMLNIIYGLLQSYGLLRLGP